MVQSFRDTLKPSAKHSGSPARHVSGYYPVLLMGKLVVWYGDKSYLKRDLGDDARRMAMDEAEAVLRCDGGSLMAEQLQRAVETGEQVA